MEIHHHHQGNLSSSVRRVAAVDERSPFNTRTEINADSAIRHLIQNVLNASIGGSILMVVYKRVIDT